MSRLRFTVASASSGEIYTLEAYRTGNSVRFSCTCAAAESGSFCKHRVGLLKGDISQLRDSSAEAHAALASLFSGGEALSLIRQIDDLDRQADAIKAKLKRTKKALSIALMG